MKNKRFVVAVARQILVLLFVCPIADEMIKHRKKVGENRCYKLAYSIVDKLRRDSNTKTAVYGSENIPEKDGFVVYSNHQGKYDALGIVLAIKRPIGVLWAKKSANHPLAREVCGLLGGVIIDLDDIKDKMTAIMTVTEEVKDGRNFLIFPEGGYTDNKNTMQEFNHGCFHCSLRSRTPIVPVCIYDSYKAMNSETFEKVVTQVHFLQPIPYEEYAGMKKAEVGELVYQRISEKLEELNAYAATGRKMRKPDYMI